MARKEWFTLNCITRNAVIVEADGLLDARAKAAAIIGPEAAPFQIGVAPRPIKPYDRFEDMIANVVFEVPANR
jgi:hypothetical protein